MAEQTERMEQTKKLYECILADDDELDRLTLFSHLRKCPFLHVAGSFGSAREVMNYMETNKRPDVVFLDIDMPEVSGLQLRDQLPEIPACIFVTSHPEYALAGFEASALDYVVKPLKADRLAKTLERLEQFLHIHYKADLLDHTLGADTIFIKDGVNHVKLNLHDIIYLEALKDYTGIITRQRKFCVLAPLGSLLKEKSFQTFIRIHRSYAIQKHFVKGVSAKEITVNDFALPIGRSYKESVEQLLQ